MYIVLICKVVQEKLTIESFIIKEYQTMRNKNKMFRGNDIETSSTSTSSSEWQTTRSRRTAVPRGTDEPNSKVSESKYVPPYMRAAAAAEAAKKPTSLTIDDFPTLCSTPKAPTGVWGAKVSFAQKVNDLIVREQRTEAEKEIEREAAKEMDGWAVLSLAFNRERYSAYADMFALGARLERLVTDAALVEEPNTNDKQPMSYTTDYDALEDVYSDEE